MKKKKIISILLLVVTILNFGNIVLADSLESIFDPSNLPGMSGGITNVDNSVRKIWSSVLLILQVLSVAAFVSAGIRYMFASADTRANIKTQIMWLILGSVFVFASSTVVSFITTAAHDILGG